MRLQNSLLAFVFAIFVTMQLSAMNENFPPSQQPPAVAAASAHATPDGSSPQLLAPLPQPAAALASAHATSNGSSRMHSPLLNRFATNQQEPMFLSNDSNQILSPLPNNGSFNNTNNIILAAAISALVNQIVSFGINYVTSRHASKLTEKQIELSILKDVQALLDRQKETLLIEEQKNIALKTREQEKLYAKDHAPTQEIAQRMHQEYIQLKAEREKSEIELQGLHAIHMKAFKTNVIQLAAFVEKMKAA